MRNKRMREMVEYIQNEKACFLCIQESYWSYELQTNISVYRDDIQEYVILVYYKMFWFDEYILLINPLGWWKQHTQSSTRPKP